MYTLKFQTRALCFSYIYQLSGRDQFCPHGHDLKILDRGHKLMIHTAKYHGSIPCGFQIFIPKMSRDM